LLPFAALLTSACGVEAPRAPAEDKAALPGAQPTDRYGQSLPPGAIARLGPSWSPPHSHIRWAAFSPDGKTLATGGDQVRMWNALTGEELRRLGGSRGSASYIGFTSDGNNLVWADPAEGVRVWQAATGKQIRRFGQQAERCALSPDGRTMALASKTIHLWDTVSARELPQFGKPVHRGSRMAFSPDGKTLAAASPLDHVTLYQVSNGKVQGRLGPIPWMWHNPPLKHAREPWTGVNTLAYSPDGKTVAAGGYDCSVHLLDVASGKERQRLDGHLGWVWDVAFSPDGRTLVSASADGTIRLWDAAGRERRRFDPGEGDVLMVAFSPDGRRLVSAQLDTPALVWDLTNDAAGVRRKAADGPR
jgi:WD40 repeat protein